METNKKVLLVDDSSLFRKYTRSILERRYDLEVVDIATVSELNNYLADCPVEKIALIILDLNLPDGNGLIALKKYKDKYKVADLPYLVISGGISKDIVPLALKYGARDIMTKPFKPEELINRIEQIFSGKPLHRLYAEGRSIWDYEEQINMELKRAQRGNYAFSLLRLMIKEYENNDSPEKWSEAMQKRFGKLLQELLRETDTILELSDNNYLFLLPFTGQKNVSIVKQKVKDVLLPGGEKNILCAVASFPEHGKSPEALIDKMEASFKLEQSDC